MIYEGNLPIGTSLDTANLLSVGLKRTTWRVAGLCKTISQMSLPLSGGTGGNAGRLPPALGCSFDENFCKVAGRCSSFTS